MSAGIPSIAGSSPGTAPYVVRKIDVTFQLGTGNFGDGASNSVTFTGMRVSAKIITAPAPTTGPADIRVFGMTLSQMNLLAKAGLVYQSRHNYILVQAGDAVAGMTTIFNGEIIEAYPDMRAQPEVSFFVFATPTNAIQLKPVPAISFPGSVPASTALSQITKAAGVTLENNGVTAILASPYFPGTAWQQILSCIRAANCFAHFDGVANVLAVWPRNGNRAGSPPVISPATGMIGYPMFQANQIIVRSLWSAASAPKVGALIQVQSQLPAATGKFMVTNVEYDLESQTPDGPWEMVITGTPQP